MLYMIALALLDARLASHNIACGILSQWHLRVMLTDVNQHQRHASSFV